MRIVGLDLSLSRPAACFIPHGWTPGAWSKLTVRSWGRPKEKHEKEDAHNAAGRRADRIVEIVNAVAPFICECARVGKPQGGTRTAIYVEDYPYGLRTQGQYDLAELRGALNAAIHVHGLVALPLNISTCRKLLLGKLPSRKKGEPPLPKGAAKVAVQLALQSMGARFDNDDECDAFAVANLGLSNSGAVAICVGGAA